MNSYNSIILFKAYLTIAVSLMTFISILVTIEMWKILKITLLIFLFNDAEEENQIYIVNQALQSRCMWLSSISLLECFIGYKQTSRGMYNLALCYHKLNLVNIAEYYYISISKNSSYFLQVQQNRDLIYKNIKI